MNHILRVIDFVLTGILKAIDLAFRVLLMIVIIFTFIWVIFSADSWFDSNEDKLEECISSQSYKYNKHSENNTYYWSAVVSCQDKYGK